jgi:hypothetical protein
LKHNDTGGRTADGELHQSSVPSVPLCFKEISLKISRNGFHPRASLECVAPRTSIKCSKKIARQRRTEVHRTDDWLHAVLTDVDGLGSFLGSDLVKRCPVILTGRPESALNRNQAFVDNQWRTLRVMPFDHKRRVRYLGKQLAEKILLDPEDEDIDFSTSDEELRKHQWKDLVEVQLLLNLMKRLATAQEGSDALMSIRSRHDLYALAVKELIQQGWRSAKDNDKALLMDEFNIRGWLGRWSCGMTLATCLKGSALLRLGNRWMRVGAAIT